MKKIETKIKNQETWNLNAILLFFKKYFVFNKIVWSITKKFIYNKEYKLLYQYNFKKIKINWILIFGVYQLYWY